MQSSNDLPLSGGSRLPLVIPTIFMKLVGLETHLANATLSFQMAQSGAWLARLRRSLSSMTTKVLQVRYPRRRPFSNASKSEATLWAFLLWYVFECSKRHCVMTYVSLIKQQDSSLWTGLHQFRCWWTCQRCSGPAGHRCHKRAWRIAAFDAGTMSIYSETSILETWGAGPSITGTWWLRCLHSPREAARPASQRVLGQASSQTWRDPSSFHENPQVSTH